MTEDSGSQSTDLTRWTRVRLVVNWINLSTPLGFLAARVGGATVRRQGRGTWLATEYRYGFPVASAFTVGNVIVSRHSTDYFDDRPRLLAHEDRHCTQYAFCLGPVMVVLYVIATGFSWLLTGSHASLNPFERLAGLDDGGYERRPLRFTRSSR